MRTTVTRLRRIISSVLVEAVESQKAREDILKFLYDEPDNEHTADDLEYFAEWFCDSTDGYGEEDYEAIEALTSQMVNDGSIQVHVTPDYELLYHPDRVPSGGPSESGDEPPSGNVVVHFPSEYFSHGYLESNFMEAPSQPKFVDFDPNGEDYQVEGSYEDLKFIWDENYGDTPGNFDDYILS